MQLKTLLNRVHPVKGFVYEKVELTEVASAPNGCEVRALLRPRRGSRGLCSGCGQGGPTYDTGSARRFMFVPLWGMHVILLYAMRRIECSRCGVKVERVPWAEGKNSSTIALQVFVARWARRLSWKEVSEVFRLSWDSVFRSVKSVVSWGLEHRSLAGIEAIGVDEVAHQKGHRYLTVVYQLDQGRRRLLHVSEGRSSKSFLRFFRMLQKAGSSHVSSIPYVCSDMWRPYLKVIRKKLPSAVHILDRYHIVANLNRALDEIRAGEARRMKAEGYEPQLAHTRWCFLKRRANLTKKQRLRLKDVLEYDLKTVRAYLKIEAFQMLWEYTSPVWAGKFLDAWCTDVMRSRLEPLKTIARSLRRHRPLILNWFVAQKQFNSGIVEGLNTNVKLRFRKAYGYRTFDVAEVALYHQLGKLPEPELAHGFC